MVLKKKFEFKNAPHLPFKESFYDYPNEPSKTELIPFRIKEKLKKADVMMEIQDLDQRGREAKQALYEIEKEEYEREINSMPINENVKYRGENHLGEYKNGRYVPKHTPEVLKKVTRYDGRDGPPVRPQNQGSNWRNEDG